MCQPTGRPIPTLPIESTTTTTTVGPTTTTEVRSGMNLCDPLMKNRGQKHGYEINMVICEANEICQPFPNDATVGYIVFYTVFKIYMS